MGQSIPPMPRTPGDETTNEPRPRILPTLAKCLALSAFVVAFVLAADVLRDYVAHALTTPAQAVPQPGQPGYDDLFTRGPRKPAEAVTPKGLPACD